MEKKFELLKALSRCRVVDVETMENELGIPESVAMKCLSEKLIGRDNQKGKSVFLLTEKGEQYVKQEIPEIKQFYRGFVLEQDLELMRFYAKLNKNFRDSWITKDDFIVQFQLTGTVDGAYLNEQGDLVGIKVLNNNSTFKAVEKVEDFLLKANIPHINYVTYKTL